MTERPSVKLVAKVLLGLIVVAGLAVATRQAMLQWGDRQAELIAAAAEVDEAIDREKDPQQRDLLVAHREELLRSVPRLQNLNWPRIGIASLLYLLSLVPGGVVLCEASRAIGHRVDLRQAISAQVVGHLGKYVPGKAMVVVMRAARLRSANVPIVSGSIAVVMETLLMMAVGAAIAGVLVLWLPVPRWIAGCSIIGASVALLPTFPPLLSRVLRRLRPQDSPTDLRSSWRFFVQAWFWQAVAWALIGASFTCLVTSLPGGTNDSSWQTIVIASTASIALAMVAGFVSLLPGGAGVRELTLAIVLAPVVGQTQALLGAIAARFLFIAVELIAAGLVYAVERSSSSRTIEAST
ncbi:MAG: lysylphosphatidylglycerol synthase domain-containing protein [Planctomycetota bacterium]